MNLDTGASYDSLSLSQETRTTQHHVAEVAAQGQIMQWIAALQNHPHISQMQDRQSLSSQPFVLPANVKTVPSGSSHQPTTFTPTDDSILARALYDCQGSGISYKQAIEGLHLVSFP